MEHSVGVSQLDVVRPWRRATYIAAAVAGVELLLLLVLGGIVLGPLMADALTGVAENQVVAEAKQTPNTTVRKPKQVRAVASLPRGRTKVVVLNGNGQTGAAAEAADRVRSHGYRIGVVGNADRSDYARSLVMYRGGFRGEAERLAGDLGIRVVAPLDGMRPRELGGGHAVVVLGAR